MRDAVKCEGELVYCGKSQTLTNEDDASIARWIMLVGCWIRVWAPTSWRCGDDFEWGILPVSEQMTLTGRLGWDCENAVMWNDVQINLQCHDSFLQPTSPVFKVNPPAKYAKIVWWLSNFLFLSVCYPDCQSETNTRHYSVIVDVYLFLIAGLNVITYWYRRALVIIWIMK